MPTSGSKRRRLAATAVALIALFSVTASGGVAAPQELEHAEEALQDLNVRLSALVEEYDAAAVRLAELERRVGDLRGEAERARERAARARDLLAKRAREAYTQGASRLEVLLGSGSFAELSERMEFLDSITENEADLATRAEVARVEALRAGEELDAALAGQRREVARLEAKRAQIEAGIAEQRALVRRLERDLARPVLAPAPAPDSAPLPSVPSASGGAQDAIAAAQSVIGTPYVWAGASPETGFDCSGLTMWAWAHGGVSLPHSSQAQYAVLPRVARDDLQPGDLVFFYSPIHHVGLYVGGGQMIHAPHTGSYVHMAPVDWDNYVGAGRPGV